MRSILRMAATCSGAAIVLLLSTASAQAATIVNYAWTGNAGYSATGSFIYDAATTPASFSEKPGAGRTSYLQSFSIAFFDQQHQLLESGSSIVNGVSSDSFFRLDYNSQTNIIGALDGDIGGSNYQYFLTNLRSPSGMVVTPGSTTFNLFVRTPGTPNLDIASSIQVTSVTQTPEPATFSLLTATGLGVCALAALRRQSRRS